jgi:putative N6-adenine-specific DNA methylase
MEVFATCGQGLEDILLMELLALGFDHATKGYGGVYITITSFDDVYKINYCSRVASRVLLPLQKFNCYNKDSIYQNAVKINWSELIPKGKTFAIDGNVSHPALKNSLYAVQVLKDAICDSIRDKRGTRPDVDIKEPDVQLNLFIHQNKGVISFDTSGVPLYKRGYRQQSVVAPLQETLAAAILMISPWEFPLIDPCCGSGTFLVEAALMATKTPPGFFRKKWGFMLHPQFDSLSWLRVKNAADDLRIPLAPDLIAGVDTDPKAIAAAKANLRAAGFDRGVRLVQADFIYFEPNPQPKTIVTNPPYGMRIQSNENVELPELYRELGHFMKRKSCKPAKGFILTGSPDLAKEVGLSANKRHKIFNGGIESRLLEFDLYNNQPKTSLQV